MKVLCASASGPKTPSVSPSTSPIYHPAICASNLKFKDTRREPIFPTHIPSRNATMPTSIVHQCYFAFESSVLSSSKVLCDLCCPKGTLCTPMLLYFTQLCHVRHLAAMLVWFVFCSIYVILQVLCERYYVKGTLYEPT